MFVRLGFVAACGFAALAPSIVNADPDAERTASAATNLTTTTVTMEIVEPGYDGLQSLLDEEARKAMADGNFRRAQYLFWRLLAIDPDDTRALREAGRVAQALGDLEYSVNAFAKVELLTGGHADPELHYLRGEALDALGRHDEAEQEWQACERELALKPLDLQGTMWLARIQALRKHLGASIALYQSVLPIDREGADYAAVVLAQVEAYCMSKEWKAAERELRKFLEVQPEHPRAQAILAWVLEARGTDVEAAQLRAAFAGEWTEHPRKTVEYARALERINKLPAALARYREARALGIPGLDRDIARLEGRVAPEIGAGIAMRADANGNVAGWNAGANLPFGSRHRVILNALQEQSSGGGIMGDDTVLTGSIWAVLGDRHGHHLGLGAGARDSDHGQGVGGSAWLATSQDRAIQVQLRGDYNQAWRESATTVREGGVVDAASAVGYVNTNHNKLLFSAGVQGRRLALAPMPGGPSGATAAQVLGIGGVDWTVTSDPQSLARGEMFGDEMLAPRSLSSAIVLSYRHYELSGDNPFSDRLWLVTRSSLDELSASVSQVVDPHGMIAAELHGGVGHDWIRDGQRYRGGGSLMLSFTRNSRFTLDYDLASESYTGLVGRRHQAQAVLHVDL